MKKNIKISLLIVLLSLITSSNVLKAQANVDSILKSYQTFFTSSNKYGRNDSVGKFYDIRGIKMYVEVYGQGEPLLLIHGNWGSIRRSSPLIHEFQNKYKVGYCC